MCSLIEEKIVSSRFVQRKDLRKRYNGPVELKLKIGGNKSFLKASERWSKVFDSSL